MAGLRIIHVAGTRPNFVKVAPLMGAMADRATAFEQSWVHTGQHGDASMSESLIGQLGLPPPVARLEVAASSPGVQIAQIIERLSALLEKRRPDWVVVVGDVSSTLAAVVSSHQLGIPIAHVEAGLRSFDRAMPEEGNRIVADHLAELLFTPSADADANLAREGIPAKRIHQVGNVMIDSLVRLLPAAAATLRPLVERLPQLTALRLADPDRPPYVLATLHRPGNVDPHERLRELLAGLKQIARRVPVVFPVHPRTARRLAEMGPRLDAGSSDLYLVDPLPYLEFIALESRAAVVLTDSGGVQEETTALGVPCLTVRPNTERPLTLSAGTNRLVEPRAEALAEATATALAEPKRASEAPPLWDGRAAERIVQVFEALS